MAGEISSEIFSIVPDAVERFDDAASATSLPATAGSSNPIAVDVKPGSGATDTGIAGEGCGASAG